MNGSVLGSYQGYMYINRIRLAVTQYMVSKKLSKLYQASTEVNHNSNPSSATCDVEEKRHDRGTVYSGSFMTK